ncbi:PIG-L family deacetylase [Streptomyces zagrosensis]|uniref:LmbE family N-acetylglucosaminyl deacetylase n=1 Tax=Streptomyces zagrosensis TaxID=1042984 RepID=A0A7W9UZS4_9ACTN|nr:PIG-L family deacetylase [Streptomyces zagrosensis]MBB5937368.1 LmbE family N-acetylglucosaminyl deacetylase [Streptomyces zagrosensis]
MTRRSALAGIAAVTAVAAAGCAGGGSSQSQPARRPVRAVDPSSTDAYTTAAKPLLLQVMAHPDDDLYFMNPDAQQLVRAGVPVVSVYLTAGEAVGKNWVPGMPKPTLDRAAYSSARHQGLRQAYATMLGVDTFTPWRTSVLDLPGGVRAETNVLIHGRRKARLIFLNIAMASPDDMRLPALWSAPGTVMQTLAATGSPCQTISSYDHETLVDVLAGIMDTYRPTVLHTMDPDPEFQAHDAVHPKDNDYGSCSDHRDHTPTALFTWKAMSQWVADATRRDRRAPRFTTLSFRGYYNQRWPYNLPPAVVERKLRLVDAYGGDPHWECGNAAGCGDYGQGHGRALRNRKAWIRSTHYRYPGAQLAVRTDRSGRLEAYGVLGTQAARWRETAPGSGRWSPPQNLGGGPLAPALAVVTDAAGRTVLLGLRFSLLEGQGGGNAREIVVLEQRTPDGEWGRWTSLGTPERRPMRGRRVGTPAAVATPDGRVHLFARTAAKGVATRVREANGRWGPWRDLGGNGIQDGLTTTVDRQQRVHVFAAGHDTVHHWTQDAPGEPVYFQPLTGLPQPSHQPGVALAPDGALTVVYRAPAAVRPVAYRFTPPAGADARRAAIDAAALRSTPLRHFDGYGPIGAGAVAVRGGKDTVVLVGRAEDGTVQAQRGISGAAAPRRAPAGWLPVGTSALATGLDQQVCVVGMGAGADPWVWRPHPTSDV